MKKPRVRILTAAFTVSALLAAMALSATNALASSGQITRAEANADWTQGSIVGNASWEGDCATSAPCEFEPYVTVGTSECSSNERSWPHSNAQLALAWSGTQGAGAGSASFDVDVSLSGEPEQLACLALLETYEERPDCQIHPQPGTVCPMWIRMVQNSVVLDEASLTTPSPTIESESVSSITPTGATLEAEINPQSLERGAYYQFQLVANASEYQSEFACPTEGFPAGSSLCIGLVSQEGALPIDWLAPAAQDQSVSLDLASEGLTLQPSTTYHYRVIAARAVQSEDTIEWEDPIVYGSDQTLTTSAAPAGKDDEQPFASAPGSPPSDTSQLQSDPQNPPGSTSGKVHCKQRPHRSGQRRHKRSHHHLRCTR